jgi:hypothetical protein
MRSAGISATGSGRTPGGASAACTARPGILAGLVDGINPSLREPVVFFRFESSGGSRFGYWPRAGLIAGVFVLIFA